ncbi:hypothetical protein VTO42DRAFT_5797 [Malbranchea cinnamomea]
MPPPSPSVSTPSPGSLAGTKRPYLPDELPTRTLHNDHSNRQLALPPVPTDTSGGAGSRAGNPGRNNGASNDPRDCSPTTYSSFRNVSACNRCRLRKNRCDQRLPRCRSCEKAGVHCVGYDPTTKREIPRSYVFFLESRVTYLEGLLTENNIAFRPGQPYEGETTAATAATGSSGHANGSQAPSGSGNGQEPGSPLKVEADQDNSKSAAEIPDGDPKRRTSEPDRGLDKLVSNIGMVSFQGASDPRYLGSTSGISFARVVFAALRSSVQSNGSVSDRSMRASERRASLATTNSNVATNGGGSSMRDSFFGLQTRPTMKCAPFPDRDVAERLVNLYFEHANPQIPILHRGEFMELFERIYSDEANRSARDMYILNIVCAIGAGIIFETKSDGDSPNSTGHDSPSQSDSLRSPKRQKLSSRQSQPEEYHASAVVHLEAFLCSSSPMDGSGSALEELQAVLLLASFALLRPVAPGLWYIVGVAVRLAIDLGLHYEDGAGVDTIDENEAVLQMARRDRQTDASASPPKLKVDPRERGRREWVRDLRRRLFWCTYAFDRLVSTCVGRPFGITDDVITTEFPSSLDDKYITKSGFLEPPCPTTPSYKHVAHHYLKLRLLQSEIQQVLQYRQAQAARRANGARDSHMQDLSSPYLQRFESFRSWRRDIHQRLFEWRASAPSSEEIGVRFPVEFLELNYWQTVITLYRPSLTVPAPLVNELSPRDDNFSPTVNCPEEAEDEDDIYLKVAEAGQKVLRLYRQLHCIRLVNYTYLATHHIFMAGISFLYAIWHSPLVREQLTFDEVDFTVYSAISVLNDLMEKCPPAEACRDAFERMSKATIKMCLSTTGFGPGAEKATTQQSSQETPQSHRVQLQAKPLDTREATVTRIDGFASPHDLKRAVYRPESSTIPIEFKPGTRHRAGNSPQYLASQGQFPNNRILRTNQNTSSYIAYYPSSQHQSPPQAYSLTDPFKAPYQSHQPQAVSQSVPVHSDQTFADLTDLDFLHFSTSYPPLHHRPPYENITTSGPGVSHDAEVPLMSSMPPFDGGRPAGTGLDLRFGMGVDFQHDWSDGGGIDLFDGYFFGAGGGANGYGI